MSSLTDVDLSASLDTVDIDNLMSLIGSDDNVFEDLDKLNLPTAEFDSFLATPTTNNSTVGFDINELDQLLTYYDALEYQPLISGLIPGANPQDTPNYQSMPTAQFATNEVCGDVNPLSTVVLHDHTYAMPSSNEDSAVVKHESTMLSTVGSCDTLSCDLVGRVSDDNEDNSDDTGYASMSPSSTASNNNTDTTLTIPVPLGITLSTHPDPVKLIDERIKFFMNRQQVQLTEEEKETLKAEGLPIPTTLPLTKLEERALKTVRRKIRNKIAAQESRKKKKQYMESLEDRLKYCSQDNRKLMKKVESLESENQTLRQQLAQLQLLVARATNPVLGRSLHVGTCLMVIVLCFGVLFGNLLPYKVSLMSDTSYIAAATVRSRALLSVDSPPTGYFWSSWKEFYKSLLPGQDLSSPMTSNHAHNYEKLNHMFGVKYSHYNITSNQQLSMAQAKA